MRIPEITLQEIHRLMPEFEAAVYDPLVNELHGELAGLELENARTHVARAGYCRETTEAAYEFMTRRLGLVAIRHEVHALPDEYHHFLSINGAGPELTGADLIIDPTYLQFTKNVLKADLSALHEQYPRVFVGTRSAVTRLIQGPKFTAEKAVLYMPDTRVPLH